MASDLIGGFNGIYGTNADTGGGNSGNNSATGTFSPVAGPGAYGLTGSPSAKLPWV